MYICKKFLGKFKTISVRYLCVVILYSACPEFRYTVTSFANKNLFDN
jgi:hypothetical protein